MLTLEDLERMGIECWADNDGGLWYYSPLTGNVEVIY